MKRCALIAFLTLTVLLAGAATGQQNFVGENVSFQCGDVTLIQTVKDSGEEVFQGSNYIVIVTTKNVGSTTGQVSTNFLFTDPNGAKVDGGRGPEYYTLEPGQSHSFSWSHGFGCTNRPKGEYYLGIGTQPYPTNQAANYIFREVELVNGT